MGAPAHASLTMQETRSGGSSDSEARMIMNDEMVEPSVDVRNLPSGGVTTLVERVRTTTGSLATATVQRMQEALSLDARAALVMDAVTGDVLYSKSTDQALPIASITKLMTAMVTIDARLNMGEQITLVPSDFVGPKKASSNLRVGDTLNRAELLLISLMKSENPASKALARTYPGGYDVFMREMNNKARALNFNSMYFGDPTGLDPRNVSSARDLAALVSIAYDYGVIRQFSSYQSYDFNLGSRTYKANNTNGLVRDGQWNIGLSKTGYIREAGRCVVMQANVNNRPAVIVLMGANSSQSRSGDATRILGWLQNRFGR
ncbi:MAG: D-alanyl-D-alanine endopeptidase [Pseudomonadota bacterium]|nr:D-alanyl-D-alanine endopeptidase [Pseudomonadota bacterium]